MDQQNLPEKAKNPVDDIEFGNLIELPRLYAKSLGTVNGAKVYAETILAPFEVIDIKTIDALEMEKLMEPVRENRGFLAEVKTEISDGRMPHTRKMDAIKSLFTGLEKDIDNLDVSMNVKETAWETEKIRRGREAAAKAQKKIEKSAEATRIASEFTNAINRNFAASVLNEMAGMSGAYYDKKADELTAYGDALGEWIPELDKTQYLSEIVILDRLIFASHHDTAERQAILTQVEDGLFPALAKEWADRVTAERDRLVTLIPSRINELNTVAPEVAQTRIDAERAAVVSSINQDVEAKAEVVSMNADNEKLNAVLTHAPAEISAPAAKGTKVKQRYDVKAHTAFPAIITHWVKNHLGKLTLDEATKKLSFMLTAANEDLNKKEGAITLVADGLVIVEDVSVRKQRQSNS